MAETSDIPRGDAVPPWWPQFDPQVMRQYGGQWVVAVGREIVAAGPTPADAQARARSRLRESGREVPARLVAIAVCRPEAVRS